MQHTCKCGVTPPHPTFGACMRSKNIRIGWAASSKGIDLTKEKNAQAELDAYADARRQGVQPEGTAMGQVRAAMEISETTGRAYDAGDPLKGTEMEPV